MLNVPSTFHSLLNAAHLPTAGGHLNLYSEQQT